METIDDIVREMRKRGEKVYIGQCQSGFPERWKAQMDYIDIIELTDRIEAAHKREIADALDTGAFVEATRKIKGETVTDCNALNGAKCREALEEIDKNTDLLDIAENIAPKLHPSHSFVAVQIRKIVRAALTEPPRNCDVGTPQEQQDRFREFCRHYESMGECGIGRSKAACPAFQGGRNPDCSLWWAHMPYKEGEKK